MRFQVESPLLWPSHAKRAPMRVAAKFGRKRSEGWGGLHPRGWGEARDYLSDELERLGGDTVVLTINQPVNKDARTLTANRRRPEDPGVAVYFDLNGTRQVIAIDRYMRWEDNVWALGRTIEAIRQIERDGGPTISAAALSGFKALPGMGESSGSSWWEVLELDPDAGADEVRKAYRKLAAKYHPDNKMTSDKDLFLAVQVAMRQGLAAVDGRVG